MRAEVNPRADETVVNLALKELHDAELLDIDSEIPIEHAISRRALLRKLGLMGAAVLVPTIVKISAPMAVQAATCLQLNGCTVQTIGQPCGPPICSHICCPDLQCKPTCDDDEDEDSGDSEDEDSGDSDH